MRRKFGALCYAGSGHCTEILALSTCYAGYVNGNMDFFQSGLTGPIQDLRWPIFLSRSELLVGKKNVSTTLSEAA